MHKEFGSRVTLPCHIHLGGALKIINIEYMHSSPTKVNDHIKINKIILNIGGALKVNDHIKCRFLSF